MLQAAAAATLALALPARARADEKPLVVGGLPVTCNLTMPVACAAAANDAAAKTAPLFEYARFSGWPVPGRFSN